MVSLNLCVSEHYGCFFFLTKISRKSYLINNSKLNNVNNIEWSKHDFCSDNALGHTMHFLFRWFDICDLFIVYFRKMIADIFGESGDEEEEEFTVSTNVHMQHIYTRNVF